jgi:RNA polymerase sigma factor (sigma-70 family)
MAVDRDSDTSITLMMRVQQDPADSRAWEEFVDRYRPMISTWCRRWGAQDSDAEDIAQVVLLKLLSAMKRFHYDPGRSFRAWLRTVTQNAWKDFLSSRPVHQALDAGRCASLVDSRQALADLERTLEEGYTRELLDLAMRRVEHRVKQVTWLAFRLTAIDNRPGADAAKELGIPVAHVFVAKHRVQKMLEEEIRNLEMKEPLTHRVGKHNNKEP